MPDFFVIYYNAGTGKYEAVNGPNANKSFTGTDGTDANGLAAVQERKSGKYVSLPTSGATPTTTTVAQAATSVSTSL